MTDVVRIGLPFPISVNALYRRTRQGVKLTPRYARWKRDAGYLLLGQHPKRIAGPVVVDIELVAPNRRRRDGDNLVKGVLDLLVTHCVIEDDRSEIVLRSTPVFVAKADHPCTVTIRRATP